MRRIRHSGYVLALLLILAVVPAALLVYLQYRSLSQVQNQMREAMTANLQQAVIGARVEAENDFYRWPRRVLLGEEIHQWLRDRDVERMHDVALAARRICPQVSIFFGYLVRPGVEPEVFIFRPGTARRSMEFNRYDTARAELRKLSADLRVTTAHFYAEFAKLENQPQQVFFHLVDDDPVEPKQAPHSGFIGYYGFAAPAKALAEEYFTPLLEKHLARVATASAGTPVTQGIGGIFNEAGTRLGVTKSGALPIFSVQERMDLHEGILPGWTMRAGLPDGEFTNFNRGQFVGSIGLFLVIACLLAGTIIVLGMATARERELSLAKTEFVAAVSHELKTPLSLIRGFVETLQLNRLGAPSQREEYFGIIHDEIARLSTMIDRILDLSKIEVGLKRYQPEPVDLAALIEETLIYFSNELDRRGFTLEQNIDPNLPLAEVDPQAFSQALSNLLSNAVKYSGSDRHIVVSALTKGGLIEVCVCDHGLGIPKRDQGRIFEKFYRAGHTASTVAGAGLGLALVQHFVHAHGGEITVTSTPGKGSRFAIFLPART